MILRKRTFLFSLAACSLFLNGCWDDRIYNLYVQEDGLGGHVNVCPPPSAPPGAHLSYVHLPVTSDGKEEICAKDCTGKENDCYEFTSEKCKIFEDILRHNICPKNQDCQTEDDVSYYCGIAIKACKDDKDCKEDGWKSGSCINNRCVATNADACAENAHFYNPNRSNSNEYDYGIYNGDTKCTSDCICEINSSMHCGTHFTDCNGLITGNKATSVACVQEETGTGEDGNRTSNARCAVLACQTGYHSDSNGNACVEDDETSCDGIACNLMEGWISGKCDDGKCVAKICKDGYHTFEQEIGTTCELDSATACGRHDKNCEVENKELLDNKSVASFRCEKTQDNTSPEPYKCVPAACGENYHWNEDQTACLPDTITQCGYFANDCTQMAGWAKGENNDDPNQGGKCENRRCVVEKCDSTSFYLKKLSDAQSICLPNTNQHCGSEENDCKNEYCVGGSCKTVCAGEFVSECTPGNCVNLKSLDTCGGCNINCQTLFPNADVRCNYNNDESSCLGDKCCEFVECKRGFHNVGGGHCEKDSIKNCGSTGNECKAGLNASVDCINGECKSQCKTGYADCSARGEGCETRLDDYGLKNCSECADGYTACGDYITEQNIFVPLCLKQGYTLTNYSTDKSTSNDFYKSQTVSKTTYYYEYKNKYIKTNFLDDHYYRVVAGVWQGGPNNVRYEWSSDHCAVACNSNKDFEISGIPKRDKIETWSHFCQPKQTCHMFDSFEYKNNAMKLYYDFGCEGNIKENKYDSAK